MEGQWLDSGQDGGLLGGAAAWRGWGGWGEGPSLIISSDKERKKGTCSPSVKTLFWKLQEMVGVGSPEASQVSVTCSSNSEAVWLFR